MRYNLSLATFELPIRPSDEDDYTNEAEVSMFSTNENVTKWRLWEKQGDPRWNLLILKTMAWARKDLESYWLQSELTNIEMYELRRITIRSIQTVINHQLHASDKGHTNCIVEQTVHQFMADCMDTSIADLTIFNSFHGKPLEQGKILEYLRRLHAKMNHED